MIEPGEIQQIAKENDVTDKQIEKDYVISWILYAISQNNFLSEQLAFKGGTVLKKVYYDNYRFSEDMDFTLINDEILDEQLDAKFRDVIDFVLDESRIRLQVNKAEQFKKMWETFLKHQVSDLPKFEDVFRDLSKHLKKIEKSIK